MVGNSPSLNLTSLPRLGDESPPHDSNDYDENFENIRVLFEENLKDTLGETLSKAGKTQIKIAETEKYACLLLMAVKKPLPRRAAHFVPRQSSHLQLETRDECL